LTVLKVTEVFSHGSAVEGSAVVVVSGFLFEAVGLVRKSRYNDRALHAIPEPQRSVVS